jgi:hypothetical protein
MFTQSAIAVYILGSTGFESSASMANTIAHSVDRLAANEVFEVLDRDRGLTLRERALVTVAALSQPPAVRGFGAVMIRR